VGGLARGCVFLVFFPSDWATSSWLSLCIIGTAALGNGHSFLRSERVWFLFWLAKRLISYFLSRIPIHLASQHISDTEHGIGGPVWQAGFIGWVPGMGRRWEEWGTLFRVGSGKRRLCITRLRRIPPTYPRFRMVLLFASPIPCYLFIVYFIVDLAWMPVLRRSALRDGGMDGHGLVTTNWQNGTHNGNR
jgi:hypothetical protein